MKIKLTLYVDDKFTKDIKQRFEELLLRSCKDFGTCVVEQRITLHNKVYDKIIYNNITGVGIAREVDIDGLCAICEGCVRHSIERIFAK